MRFKAWLQDYLKQIAQGRKKLNPVENERIKVYLELIHYGYSREKACEILDFYMEEEGEA